MPARDRRSPHVRTRRLRRCGLAIAVWGVTSVLAGTTSADDATAEYFEGLRQRRLFGVAEGHCFDRLKQKDLAPALRAELTLELSRTFAEHAKFTTGDEQADLWNRAVQVLDNFLAANPEHPQAVLFQGQRALVETSRAEFLRWQVELAPHDPSHRQNAEAAFVRALDDLQALEQSLAERLRAADTGRRAAERDVPPHQVRSLLFNVRFQIGRSLVERAKLREKGEADRAADLLDAEGWLRPLAGGVPGDELTWMSQLALAECVRLKGDHEQALHMLAEIEKAGPPQDVKDRVVAERVRLALDVGQPDDAASLLVDYRHTRGRLPGELGYLKVKATVALWELADEKGETELSAKLLEQTVAQTDRAEHEVGGFWAERSRRLSAFARESSRFGGDLALSMRIAEAHYHGGRTDDAVAEYARAIEAARRSGQDELAGQLAFTRASVQLNAGRWEPAAESFHAVVNDFPQSDRAADAHLLCAYCLGRTYDASRTRGRREAYAAALDEHRERFADSPTRTEATWMLARLKERRLQWTQALPLYLEIPADHARGPAAQVAVARCYEAILDRLRELDEETAAWEQDALDRLGGFVEGFPPEPAPVSVTQSELALRLARLELNHRPPQYAHADALLARAAESLASHAEGSDDASQVAASLLKTVRQLRIVSLAGQGRIAEAQSLMPSLSGTAPEELLGLLGGLTQLAERSPDDFRRREVGQLQLQAALDLEGRRDDLSEAQRQQLDLCLARAYAATGQVEQAADVYQGLLKQTPEDRALLRALAEQLMDCGTPECLTEAKAHWRRLESLEEPGTRPWLLARYHVARCCYLLEQYDECRKLLGLTRVLYPNLGGNDLRQRFESLQRDVRLAQ